MLYDNGEYLVVDFMTTIKENTSQYLVFTHQKINDGQEYPYFPL